MRDYRRPLIALAFMAAPSIAAAQSAEPAQSPDQAAASSQIATVRAVTVPAGTLVALELSEPLSSETSQRDHEIALRLAEPIVIDGVIAVPQGAEGRGVILDAGSARMDGRPGKLIVAGRYLMIDGQRVPLRRTQLLASGDHETRAIQFSYVAGNYLLTFGDTALVGDDIVIPAGTRIGGRLGATDNSVEFLEALAEDGARPPLEAEDIPEGQGRVVFFRRDRFAGAGRSYPLRSGSATIGPLRNASFRIYDTPEGIYEFATGNGQETLRFEVEAGVTYYVEWLLAEGALLRRPLLRPSSRTTFESARASLTQTTP